MMMIIDNIKINYLYLIRYIVMDTFIQACD